MIEVSEGRVLYVSDASARGVKLELRPIAGIVKYRVSGLADRVGVSIRTLEREFEKCLGISPKSWLRELRVHTAKRLLEDGMRPHDVAANLGFKRLSRFADEYRHYFGERPRPEQRRSLGASKRKPMSLPVQSAGG